MLDFNCKCGQKIKVDDKHAGKSGKCPKCKQVIAIPLPAIADLEPEAIDATLKLKQQTKACDYCGEEILEIAKRCKHCGEFLVDKEYNSMITNNKRQSSPNTSSYNSELLGTFVLITPVIATLLIYFWVGSMALIDRPHSKLNMIMIGTVLLTAILAVLEANQLDMGKNNNRKRETGPIGWFFCFALLWIIAYPAYLYKRSKYGLRNYCLVGILVALIFIGASALMGMMIDSSVQEFNDSLQDLQNIFN